MFVLGWVNLRDILFEVTIYQLAISRFSEKSLIYGTHVWAKSQIWEKISKTSLSLRKKILVAQFGEKYYFHINQRFEKLSALVARKPEVNIRLAYYNFRLFTQCQLSNKVRRNVQNNFARLSLRNVVLPECNFIIICHFIGS